jgi:HD superfamily phosphodiesterase
LDNVLEIWIDRAEASWLDELYANAENLYRNSSLPSHDHSHHLRVWNLSKTLLREIATFNSTIDQSLVEGILIAAFFHDLGMVYSTRVDHGHLGVELCLEWFKAKDRDRPENFDEILRAIELHDRKDEQIHSSFQRETPPEILGIISVADDLEAMGIIGIYRYAEIYLRRGISLEELGDRILENASARFENLSRACLLCGRVIENYRQQYEELRLFFEAYKHQLLTVSQADTVSSGPLGVINYIRTPGREKSELDRADREVSDYFRKLEHELDQARL